MKSGTRPGPLFQKYLCDHSDALYHFFTEGERSEEKASSEAENEDDNKEDSDEQTSEQEA